MSLAGINICCDLVSKGDLNMDRVVSQTVLEASLANLNIKRSFTLSDNNTGVSITFNSQLIDIFSSKVLEKGIRSRQREFYSQIISNKTR